MKLPKYTNGSYWAQFGYTGRLIGDCEFHYHDYLSSGLSSKEAIVKTLEDIKLPSPKVELRDEPLKVDDYVLKDARRPEEAVGVIKQLERLSKLPIAVSVKAMPDACVAGSQDMSIPVGGVLTTKGGFLPSATSADMCCSMALSLFKVEDELSPKQLMGYLRESTHFGRGGRDKENILPSMAVEAALFSPDFHANPFLRGLEDLCVPYLGTQGDGNHFASLGQIEVTHELVGDLGYYFPVEEEYLGDLVGETLYSLVTHHGSRALGAAVYRRGVKAAEKATAKIAKGIPKLGCWLDPETQEGKDYLDALEFVKCWTHENHRLIHAEFLGDEDHELGLFNEHNSLWQDGDLFHHGKGATYLPEGKLGIIPLNMSAPILLVKGHEDGVGFAPHGAGRSMSRTEFKRELSSRVFDEASLYKYVEEHTEGLEVIWYKGKPDVSELGTAYKDDGKIVDAIQKGNLGRIVGQIKPLGCIMAGSEELEF